MHERWSNAIVPKNIFATSTYTKVAQAEGTNLTEQIFCHAYLKRQEQHKLPVYTLMNL